MNPVFNKPLNNQEQQKTNDELTSELLSQFVDMVFSGAMEEENNNLKNQNTSNDISKNNTTKDTTQEQKTQQKIEQFYTPSTATLDFVNNCIFVNNNKYYIERHVSNNDVVINRLVVLDNVYNIEQFANKFINKTLYNYRILTNDLLIYFNKERKFALKLVDKNSLIKDYYKFFNCTYLKPNAETKPVIDLLKMDQFIKGQAYFNFELKPKITYYDTEIEYAVFDEILDFLCNANKKIAKLVFKELIKCDYEYLSECALHGEFKPIYLTNYDKTKKIYIN